jgi:hypothetical protein
VVLLAEELPSESDMAMLETMREVYLVSTSP